MPKVSFDRLWRPRGLHITNLGRLARDSLRRPTHGPLRMFLCIADHYEPMRDHPPRSVQQERVDRWRREYPALVAGLADSRGRPPQHTFFYPIEEYAPEFLSPLAELCRQGQGEVEIHLHHDNDHADRLRESLLGFARLLHDRHGLLGKDAAGRITYGFIHGNWALDNARPDGRWCGVNDELTVLRETGCYADFTLPCAPAPGQTRTINGIYYAVDDPLRPKSHDRGTPARVGRPAPPDSLLLVQGPLALDWRRRKWGLLPRLENGTLQGNQPATMERLPLWLAAGVSVVGRPDWRFVKLHTHGALEQNAAVLLGEPTRRFHESLAVYARQTPGFEYYYVTAREVAALVHQAEAGLTAPDWQTLNCQGC